MIFYKIYRIKLEDYQSGIYILSQPVFSSHWFKPKTSNEFFSQKLLKDKPDTIINGSNNNNTKTVKKKIMNKARGTVS